MLSARQLDIVRTGRWDWLVDFVDTWFAVPLSMEDGAGSEEISAAESRLGLRLPAALSEWFELIGRRLIDIQDQPATPATLREQDGGLAVWVENQGVWSIITRSAEDDPTCSTEITTEENALVGTWTADRLTLALHSMLVSDTLVGVWSEALTGPLGKLKASVRGGAIQDIGQADQDRLFDAYSPLRLPRTPTYPAPARGDQHTLLRGDLDWGTGIEWATATDDAFERFTAFVDLDPPGGEHELVLEVRDPSTKATRFAAAHVDVRSGAGTSPALMEPFQHALRGGLGHLAVVSSGTDQVECRVITSRPDEAAAALLAAIPADIRNEFLIKTRPTAIVNYRIIHAPLK